MDRSECVHGILHCLPACVREVRPRESFRSWECEASSHSFSINGLLSQKRREDACALQKSRDCGTKHNGRKFAQARHGEFVLWRTAKTFIDTSTDITNSASVTDWKDAPWLTCLSRGAPRKTTANALDAPAQNALTIDSPTHEPIGKAILPEARVLEKSNFRRPQ